MTLAEVKTAEGHDKYIVTTIIGQVIQELLVSSYQ